MLAETRAAESDRQLLQRFVDTGDESAFRTIFDRHGPMLLGLCRRQLHAGELAEDVLQATFLVLARKARSIHRRENLAGWLYGVARRLICQAQRTEAARRQRERCAARVEAITDPGWDDLLRVLDAELQRLPARLRDPLLLCYLESRTQEEAAAQLGWSLSTLRRRLERGRDLLRTRMVRRGATLGAGLVATVVAPSTVRAVLTAELRQAVFAVAASALRPASVAPGILLLANGELRMTLLTKCLLGSVLALVAAGVCTLATWSAGEAPRAALPPAPPAALAPGESLKKPAAGQDLFGDPLPKGAVARLGTVELRHGPSGRLVQFTRDSKHLVSLGGGWIRRWNLATGRADINLGADHPAGLLGVREFATADGATGVSCSVVNTGQVRRVSCTEYDLQTGKTRSTYDLEVGDGPFFVPSLLSADGKLLAASGRNILVWRTTDGHQVQRLQIDDGYFRYLAFAPDGQTLFAADDAGTVHVFDVATGKETRSFGMPNVNGIHDMAVAPDGKRLATRGGGDSFVRIWNVPKGTVERTLEFPEDGAAHLLRFTPDGRTLLAGIEEERGPRRRVIRTWDVATGKPGRAWTSDRSIGMMFAVSADGALLATMNDAGVIRLWDMDSGMQRRSQPVSPSGLVAVGFAPDGKSIFTIGDDFHLRQWDTNGRQLRAPRPMVYHGTPTFVEDGRLVVIDKNERGLLMVRVEDVKTGQLIFETPGQEGVLSPDGKRLAVSGAEMVTRIYEVGADTTVFLAEPRETRPPAGSPWDKLPRTDLRPKVRGFTADGQSLIVQGEIVSVWNVQTGKQRSSWSLVRNKVLDGDGPGNFQLPGFAGGKKGKGGVGGPGVGGAIESRKRKLNPSGLGTARERLRCVAVSPDGSKIAFAVEKPRKSASQIMVFETTTGKLVHDTDLGEVYVSALAFSADGKLLAGAGIGEVRVWQLGNAKERWRFTGHLGRVDALAFSADNTRLASASNDSTVLVWQISP
jgi:RNA polymerase sigma factor (sigma-70 family)